MDVCSVYKKIQTIQVVGEPGGCEWCLYNLGRRFLFFFHYGGGERLVVSFNINKYDNGLLGEHLECLSFMASLQHNIF